MRIINNSETHSFKLVGRTQGECTQKLFELLSEANVGQAIYISREEWDRKSMISSKESVKKTGRTLSLRTLEDDKGWLVFITKTRN